MKTWFSGIEEGRQIIVTKVWRKQCKERAEWKIITEKVKNHRRL